MTKVYCYGCKHRGDDGDVDGCKSNPAVVDSWARRGKKYELCSTKNRGNDCKEYEPSWLKRTFGLA